MASLVKDPTGEGGQEVGPQDVAVVGVVGRLNVSRYGKSTEEIPPSVSGEGGYSEGGPQVVAVDGVRGISSKRRRAMSGVRILRELGTGEDRV